MSRGRYLKTVRAYHLERRLLAGVGSGLPSQLEGALCPGAFWVKHRTVASSLPGQSPRSHTISVALSLTTTLVYFPCAMSYAELEGYENKQAHGYLQGPGGEAEVLAYLLE